MRLGKKTAISISILAVFIGIYAFVLAFVLPSATFSPILQKLALTPIPSLIHFIGGGIAILLGIIQFNSSIRKYHLSVHKILGSIYFFSVFSSGFASLYMSSQAHGGLIAQVGFSLLAIIWLLTAGLALKAVLQKDIEKHRFWIYLNYALTLAALTLRLQMPFGVALFGFETFYPIVAWSCWLPNLYIAYLLVKKPKDSHDR